ncbi:hypothetical protein PWT90_08831 [Aphanocladium album]|nr:hypothetical protein PWT90_08831 [Aphanocladium album]
MKGTPATAMPPGVEFLSAAIGWIYTIFWTVSYYPFLISNIRRRTTEGVSIDFCLLNLLGMASYAIYNTVLALSSTVRRQYAERYPNNPTPIIQPNDVAYAVHGLIISIVIYSQYYPRLWGFDTSRPHRISGWCSVAFWGSIFAALVGAFVAAVFPHSMSWMWLDVQNTNPAAHQVYLVGHIKTLLTLLKYAPQMWLNYSRKSTQGLPLLPFALDIGGAVLSLLQLVLDSAYSDQPAGLSNPVKLILANVTILFDIAFFFQRFVLYRGAVDDMLDAKRAPESRRLLDPEA